MYVDHRWVFAPGFFLLRLVGNGACDDFSEWGSEFPPDDPKLSLFLPSLLLGSSGTCFNFKFGICKITIWKYLLFLYSVKGVFALFVR